MKLPKFNLALITGASSGIGKALAHLLADQGVNLIIVARSVDKLQALAKELSLKVSVEVIPCDLSDSEKRKALIDTIHKQEPDLVINNAGFGYYGEVLSYETEKMKEMLEVDVTALMELSIEAARTMVSAGKKGVVMNVSSSASFQIFPCFAVYAASKAFVNLFSESFDVEVSPHGVRVLTCCPGMIDTNFRYRASGDSAQKASSYSMTVDFAANEIWWQIQKQKPLHTFDWKYRFFAFLTRFIVPKKFLSALLQKAIEGRQSSRDLILRK